MKLFNKILIVFFCALAFTACGSDDEPTIPTPPAERTVLVYMVADNNLGTGSYNNLDLNEMIEGASAGDLNDGRLLVYHNRPGTDSGNSPLLIEVTETGLDTLKLYPDDTTIYSVEVERMREVIADAKALAPAEDYGIVFWGHATAWVDIDTFSDTNRSRSYGTDRSKWMSLASMAKALDGEQLSFAYFDCCLMGTVEVAYELKNVTRYIVASPTELEGEGMPYNLNLKHFFAAGEPDVVAMAETTFEYYNALSGRSCQMTVIDTSSLDALADATRAIFETQDSYPDGLSDVQALSKKLSGTPYKYTLCRPVYDMEHYMEILTADNPDLMSEWRTALENTVLYCATTAKEFTGIQIKRYCGLGSYVILKDEYKDYGGYTSTLWWSDVVSHSPLYK